LGEIIESKIDITDDCGIAREIDKCWHYGTGGDAVWRRRLALPKADMKEVAN
jgi:hypothetical protein